jgi:adenylate kinase
MTDANLILLGPPGAGKGTQAQRLCEALELRHLATGDLLRRHRAEGTDLGRSAAVHMDAGRLVPDDLVVSMLLDALPDAVREGRVGFLLDGFPRTIAQAEMLEAALRRGGIELAAVALIEAEDSAIIERLSGRLTCPRGHVFHLRTAPPARAGLCDHDGEPLERRLDDHPETVGRRLAVYHEATAPLVDYYETRGLLRRVDGTRPPDEVFAAIRAQLGAAKTSIS